MSDNSRLIYPTLDLFVYDLAEGLGQPDDRINQSREQFWQKVYDTKLTLGELEKFKQVETKPADYIELLEEKIKRFEPPLDGFYYPVKVDDTYALQVDCSGNDDPEKKSEPKPITCLEQIKKEITSHLNNSLETIGQSWLIWGQLAADDQDVTETAKNCYNKLSLEADPKWERDLKAHGEFLGASFFELWQLPSDRGTLSQNRHLLICLFPYNQGESIKVAGEIITRLYRHFLQLFKYRNKVIWAYHQSRQLKSDLKQASQLIQTIVSDVSKEVNSYKINLEKLQQKLIYTLTILSGYANYLSSLEEQQHTVKSNLNSYQKRLKTIAKLDPSNPDSALKFLEAFSDFAAEKYLPQIEADVASLTPGFRVVENTIKTIEGIVQIEQTKRDRKINHTIAAVGGGLAASGVAATVASAYQPPPTYKNLSFITSPALVLSLLLGAIVAVVIGKMPPIFPR